MRQMLWVDQLRQDLRYAVTLLTRDRGFTLVAALALALGIAATTSLITVVNAVILRGLPLADSDRLVAITMRDPRNRRLAMSYPDFDDWQRASRSFSGMTVMLPVAFSVSDHNRLPEQFFGPFTSTNLFTVIGQRPLLGRDFTPEDDRPGAAPVVILGYGIWQTRYGGDRAILGRTIRVNGLQPTVVGVMGPDMRFPPNSDLWMPLGQTDTPRIEGRGIRSFSVIAKLAERVTLEQARAEITNLARGTAYPTSADRLAFMRRVDERLAEIAAIESSSTTSNAPLGGGAAVQFSIDGRQSGTAERAPLVTMIAIGSGYFDALRSPLLRGRSFTDIDGLPGRDVAIVNERFAAIYFAGVDPIGHSIQLSQNPSLRTIAGTPASALTIVGVSQTIRQRNTRELEPDPVVYVPRPAVVQSNRATLLVRTARSQAETTAMLREEIRALDPDMPIFNIRTLDTDLANQRWPLIVVGSTFGLFASIGLVLSAIGLFGLTSYSVATRMREIALRMALGAMPSGVLRLLFGRVVAQVMLGLALGVLGAYALGQVLQGMLVQTSPTDRQVLAAAGVVLLAVASVTCLVPARRATRIDPLEVLRSH